MPQRGSRLLAYRPANCPEPAKLTRWGSVLKSRRRNGGMDRFCGLDYAMLDRDCLPAEPTAPQLTHCRGLSSICRLFMDRAFHV